MTIYSLPQGIICFSENVLGYVIDESLFAWKITCRNDWGNAHSICL